MLGYRAKIGEVAQIARKSARCSRRGVCLLGVARCVVWVAGIQSTQARCDFFQTTLAGRGHVADFVNCYARQFFKFACLPCVVSRGMMLLDSGESSALFDSLFC